MTLIKIEAKLILFLCVVFTFIGVEAQNVNVDSLEQVLKNHVSVDTARVNLLNNLGYAIFEADIEGARAYGKEAGIIADQLNYPEGKAASLWIIGLTFTKNDEKQAFVYFEQALKIAEKVGAKILICNTLTAIGNARSNLGDIKKSDELHKRSLQLAIEINDKKLIIKALCNIARNERSKGNYPESIKLFKQTLSFAKELNDNKLITHSFDQLAYISTLQGNYPAALEYNLSSLKINEQNNNKTGVLVNLLNIAGLQSEQNEFDLALKTLQRVLLLSKELKNTRYMSVCLTNIGYIYTRTNNPLALRYLRKALTMCENNVSQSANILIDIGAIYTERKEFDKALNSFNEALVLVLNKGGLEQYCSKAWVKIAILYAAQKQYDKAIDYAQKSLSLAQKMQFIEVEKDCYELLSEAYGATGIFKEAYLAHVQYQSLSDSLFNKKSIRELALLESSYEYDKEKRSYEMQQVSQDMKIENQKQVILFLIIASVLVLMLGATAYWSNKLKKKVLKLEIDTINHELEVNQKSMTAATLKLVQNSERDAYCLKMLENIKKNTMEEGQQDIRTLISEYKLRSYNSNWDEFEVLFQKINASFYDKLNELYPTLTPNERKLCAFLKLNMSNSHISQITFQSEEALKKGRLRLRKKLDLERDTNLAAFIQSL